MRRKAVDRIDRDLILRSGCGRERGLGQDAAAALPVRDRTLLRMHLVERASIDDIAAVYRVHRATAARWVTAARAALITQSRDRFLALARLEADETGGLASFVESQLTLSLDRILA